jgi:hypothetical protein
MIKAKSSIQIEDKDDYFCNFNDDEQAGNVTTPS